MTRKTKLQFSLAVTFFTLCLAFAVGKTTLKEVMAGIEGPTVCYACSLATEEEPVQVCHVFKDGGLGKTACVLLEGACFEMGDVCEDDLP